MVIIKKNRYFFFLFAITICLSSILGCEKKPEVVQPQQQVFTTRADKIQALSKGISTDLWENSKYLNTIYTSRELFLQESPNVKYEISPAMDLNLPRDDDHAALYATGYTAIKRYVMDEIDLSVPLDSIWKNTQTKYPEILQQYYIHKYSFIRAYPYKDLSKLFTPKQNLTKMEVFRVAAERKDSDPKVIWFQPEWDPTYSQMILNVAFPIREGHDLLGVLGCKVSLKDFLKQAIGNNGELTGILCRNGTLISASPLLYQNLEMNVPANIELSRQSTFNKEDLRKTTNPYMRTLVKNLIDSPYTNFVMNVGKKSFYVECRLVPELNWVIFKMNER